MLIFFTVLVIIVTFITVEIFRKNIYIWLSDYALAILRKKALPDARKPIHIVFCLVDHFEPMWNNVSLQEERQRVELWVREYPILARKHRDAQGRYPQHTFFYPMELYRKEHIDKLAQLCKQGFSDVEIHLHHNNDSAENLRKNIEKYKEQLQSHGLLSQDNNGNVSFGFIHGNWALDNSRRDGKWCGVNNELLVLKGAGCYADFTLPSAPSDTQTRKINSIYYATDEPSKPKSHSTGVDVEVEKNPTGDLMIIQGPLTLDWRKRKWGIFPRMENAEISANNYPTKERVDLWVQQHIHIKGEPNWIFIKVHTHGCREKNFKVLLGEPLDKMFQYLESKYNDGIKYRLHYVTARQMYDIIKAIEEERITEYEDSRD